MQADVSLQKLPPQNLEAEQAVLGAVLIENDAINKIVDILSPDDFYKETHRKIYSAMLGMFESSEPIDLVTLTNALRGAKSLENVGGASYLSTLVSLVPTAANIKNHAKIVREKAVLRKLIHTATDIISQSYDEEASGRGRDVENILDQAEKSIFEITQNKIGDSFVPLRKIVSHSFAIVEQLYERKEMVTGLSVLLK
jgi:replicative DNA helicase